MLSDLVPRVRTHLSDVPEMTVKLYLNVAAKQFCQDTLVWDTSIGSTALVANTAEDVEYRLWDGTYVRGAWMPKAWKVGDITISDGGYYRALLPREATDTDPPAMDTEGWEEVDFVSPAATYITRLSRIRIEPGNNERAYDLSDTLYAFNIINRTVTIDRGAITRDQGILTIDAILEPQTNTQIVPEWLVELYGDGIADYAIHEMMMMPNREWSAPAMAGRFYSKYQQRVSEATVQKARRGTRRLIRLDPIPFT